MRHSRVRSEAGAKIKKGKETRGGRMRREDDWWKRWKTNCLKIVNLSCGPEVFFLLQCSPQHSFKFHHRNPKVALSGTNFPLISRVCSYQCEHFTIKTPPPLCGATVFKMLSKPFSVCGGGSEYMSVTLWASTSVSVSCVCVSWPSGPLFLSLQRCGGCP